MTTIINYLNLIIFNITNDFFFVQKKIISNSQNFCHFETKNIAILKYNLKNHSAFGHDFNNLRFCHPKKI